MNCLGIILGSVWNHLGIAFGHIFSPPPSLLSAHAGIYIHFDPKPKKPKDDQTSDLVHPGPQPLGPQLPGGVSPTLEVTSLAPSLAPSLLAPSFPMEYPPPSKLPAWPPARRPASWPPASQWSIHCPRSYELGPQPLGPQLASGVSPALEVTSLAPSFGPQPLGPQLPYGGTGVSGALWTSKSLREASRE